MAELANEGPKLISVIFCPDDPQPATTLAAPVSAGLPLKTVPTSSPTSAPDSAGEFPADVMENVAVLTWPKEKAPGGISTVYLVGTAHVSKVRIVGCGNSGKSGKSGSGSFPAYLKGVSPPHLSGLCIRGHRRGTQPGRCLLFPLSFPATSPPSQTQHLLSTPCPPLFQPGFSPLPRARPNGGGRFSGSSRPSYHRGTSPPV